MENKDTTMVGQTIQQEQIPKFWGESYGFWCQTFVLAAAAVFAWLAIRSARALERQKAAMHTIFANRQDKELTGAIRHIAALHEGAKNMASYAKNENIDSEDSKLIRYALNHYEYVSVGIHQDIFDEEIYKSSLFTTVVRLYERTRPFIDQARREQLAQGAEAPTAFQDFERLACTWKESPLNKKTVKTVPK
jgi:Domain of unknown function (DUF4760)